MQKKLCHFVHFTFQAVKNLVPSIKFYGYVRGLPTTSTIGWGGWPLASPHFQQFALIATSSMPFSNFV